jgi:ribosomal protein S18 acetylase RimI-like enzyme
MVRLVPMEPARYDRFMETLMVGYAADSVRAGRWTAEEGPAEARKEIQRLVPEGLATPNHLFLSIVTEPGGEVVGAIWVALEPRGAFVYDLEVGERFRRRGYAEEAMRLLEGVVRARGAQKLLLHVFGDNTGARRLYLKLGYAETNVLMAKPLGP